MTKKKMKKRQKQSKNGNTKEMPRGSKIFILGVDSNERDIVVGLTLKGSRKMLPNLTHVKLPKFRIENRKELSSRRKRFANEFGKIFSSNKNFIISGSLLSPTHLGLVPLFEDGFPHGMRPDAIILLEEDTRELIVLPGHGFARRKNLKLLEEVRIHQQLHRQFAGSTGSPIKILKIEKGNVKKGLRELREYLMTIMR